MKNILIIGPPRVGKTTLAKMISNKISCYNIINTDVIRDGIYEAFFKEVEHKERKAIVKNAFPKFMNKILEYYQNYYNPDTYYIIEGDILSIEDALLLKNNYDIEIVCIGVPNTNETNLFKRIRENAAKYGCWTKKYSDEELLNSCSKYIEQSKKEELIAKENKLIYLDTSLNTECLNEYVKNMVQ